MGIKERREREKQLTRQAILSAALAIASENGWPALTIRKVGERIEYSPPMVYEYFASKEDVLLQLVQGGFQQLTELLQQASVASGVSEEGLLKIADAYWDFARSNRELYQLMHGLGGVPLDGAVIAQAVQQVCMTTQQALQAWAQAQGFSLPDPLGATEIIWCLLHGLLSLSLVERVEGGESRARNLMHEAVKSQLIAWKITYRRQ
ncbi:TetR/AcrR family transcriptional regulator [Ktedonosporobacter rubrisoli]|nr:TetR/AcrR family transcriptional regulator [Ktedonosporobacter rubrisoli]